MKQASAESLMCQKHALELELQRSREALRAETKKSSWLELQIKSMARLAGSIVHASDEPSKHKASKTPSPPPRLFEAALLPSPKPEVLKGPPAERLPTYHEMMTPGHGNLRSSSMVKERDIGAAIVISGRGTSPFPISCLRSLLRCHACVWRLPHCL